MYHSNLIVYIYIYIYIRNIKTQENPVFDGTGPLN
jgi:hypothetical protein